MLDKKAAIGIVIGALAVTSGSYLLIQSVASSRTQEIYETSLIGKSGDSITQLDTSNPTNPIKVIYSNFTIPYSIFNAKMLGITVDTHAKILLISIKTSGAGNLTMVIPRALIDARFGTQDDKFSVLADGQEVDYQESKTNISRTLTVSFQNGIQQIQVKEPILPNRTHVANTNFSVSYNITNGKVLGLKGDTQSLSFIISIQTAGDGVLTITIPRGLIDSRIGSQDDRFFVLVDGQEATFQEIHTSSVDRTLSIPFKQGDQEIEVIGAGY
ncbi:MAG: hypothetical protein AUF74_02155 [Thaumarchaeota archaeon 13_1_20CM_2_38_5]|nr:MAG: hypothetical protein AUI62_01470 [Thaumarchaeota archaeon 13_1_40CM_2_39_7]OLE39285.1 MAG: hypothetical protein AUF74_02155 [Thaumarchaeota archaeon 13_1_20CM_2_38_5]